VNFARVYVPAAVAVTESPAVAEIAVPPYAGVPLPVVITPWSVTFAESVELATIY